MYIFFLLIYTFFVKTLTFFTSPTHIFITEIFYFDLYKFHALIANARLRINFAIHKFSLFLNLLILALGFLYFTRYRRLPHEKTKKYMYTKN